MKKLNIIILGLTLLLMACGEGEVTIDQNKYEAKIVIDGYLYPNQQVDRIKITRNLPIGVNIARSELAISDAVVVITDLNVTPNESHSLSFNADSLYYFDDGNNLVVQHGGEYRIEVQATIEGKVLEASSTTKVPLAGFRIFDSVSTSQISFTDISQSGTLPRPVIYFDRSDQTDFYAFSILAMDADTLSFIYDVHPWGGNIELKDVKENFDTFRKSHDTIFNTPIVADTTSWTVEWFHMWFMGRYRIIAYAGDNNMKDYYLTHANVVETDGNLHEPEMNITGDGIGIFGSAIADTFYFDLLP
jgi:Domain of unknown function (DUF4249)